MGNHTWSTLASLTALFLAPLSLIFGSSAFILIAERTIPPGPAAMAVPLLVYATFPLAEDLFITATNTEPVEGTPVPPEPKDSSEELPKPKPEPVVVKPAPKPQQSFTMPETQLSASEQQTLLSIHNRERRLVGVGPLVWSDSLAESAQAWSDTSAQRGCLLEHSYLGVGEVVYYSQKTGVELSPRMPAEVMGEFLAEKKYYDEDTGTCQKGKVCGHYTQIVWGNTTEVGCGKSACSAKGEYEEIWTCHYTPIGNVEGQLPFYP